MIRRIKNGVRRALALAGLELRRVPADPGLFPPKFTTADVQQVLAAHSDRTAWVLTDGYVGPPAGTARIIDCRRDDPSIMSTSGSEDVFVYACDNDDVGLPWIRALVRAGRRFFPVHAYRPSTYANLNDVARRVLADEFAVQQAEGFAKWDFGPGDFLNLAQAIDLTAAIEGAYVEIGCYRGSSAGAALRYMGERGIARAAWFFDTFDGFAYEAASASSDAMWAGTHATEGEAVVRERIKRYLHSAVIAKMNVIEEPWPAGVGPIAVANVDVDLYEAVAAALVKVAPWMVPGGIIIAEDPGHTPALIGSRLALQEFLESMAGKAFLPVYLESGQTFLIRRA